MATRIAANTVMTYWDCDACDTDTSCPLVDLPEIGTPICGECGDDMELQPEVRIEG